VKLRGPRDAGVSKREKGEKREIDEKRERETEKDRERERESCECATVDLRWGA
jgi:hypothetical protein